MKGEEEIEERTTQKKHTYGFIGYDTDRSFNRCRL